MRRFIFITAVILLSLFILFLLLVYFTTYHPAKMEKQKIFSAKDAPIFKKGSTLKILSWNIQYFAGKNYFFWYDSIHQNGPDKRPSRADIEKSLHDTARIINDENPDIILLQEVDDGASRTDYEDQTKRLINLISKEYTCHTSCFYWKALFVPHPKITGKAGAKLSIISKYKIDSSVRLQLPGNIKDIISRQFYYKRAILQVRMPVDDCDYLILMNTHLESFAQGTDIMKKEVDFIARLLDKYNNRQWILGGDFNLLPPGQYDSLNILFKNSYNKDTEIKILLDKYRSVPSLTDLTGSDKTKWYTHFPNNPIVNKPDRTIDYIFYSNKIKLINKKVRYEDTLSISDHLPVITTFKID